MPPEPRDGVRSGDHHSARLCPQRVIDPQPPAADDAPAGSRRRVERYEPRAAALQTGLDELGRGYGGTLQQVAESFENGTIAEPIAIVDQELVVAVLAVEVLVEHAGHGADAAAEARDVEDVNDRA